MASKQKRKGDSARGDATGSPRQEVDRLIAKGWLKDAVKQAKICQRDHPSPEHHRLLQKATLLRAQELLAGGMVTAAREVASHLLDLKLTDPDLTEPAIVLLLAVGMAGDALKLQSRLDSPAAVDRLTRQAADAAVLHPERATGATPEIITGAKQIRAALEALTTDAEVKALDTLRNVARSSPFADWRLFARGLAASRRGDDAEARTNWDRLDPTRAAARIARTLSVVNNSSVPATDAASTAQRVKLERWAFGEPLIGPLQDVAQAAAQENWNETTKQVGSVRLALRRLDPALAVRLTQALISPFTRHVIGLGYREGQALIQRFTKAAEPLPIDPHWYRHRALIWEGPQGSIEDAEEHWQKYLGSLETIPTLRPDDRTTIRALVLTHLGTAYAEMAADVDDADPDSVATARRDSRQAITHLEASLKHLPTHRATYGTLMDVYEDANQPEKVAEVARRLLQVLPDDFDALEYLTDHHLHRDEPALAFDFASRARKLKPLDRGAIGQEWACLVSLAREDALNRRWAEGRAHLAAAAQLDADQSTKPHFVARQIALEIKAGQAQTAAMILAAAEARLAETAALRLGLAIEARRHRLSKLEIAKAEALWAGEAAKKVRGDAAGALAELMDAILVADVAYTGRKTHVRQVADYLARTTRIKYARAELLQVCGFLSQDKTDLELYEKMAKRGRKLFPDAPEFPLMLGAAEMEKGPFRTNIRSARGHLETALKLALAQERTHPKAPEIITEVRKILSSLDQMSRGPLGFPFSFAGFPGSGKTTPAGMFAAMANQMGMDFDEEDLDDLDEDFGPPTSPPPPRPKGSKR